MYVFQRSAAAIWQQTLHLEPDAPAEEGKFGLAVSATTNYVFIVSVKEVDVMYAPTPASMTQATPDGISVGALFGGSVAVSDDVMLIGAGFEDAKGAA